MSRFRRTAIVATCVLALGAMSGCGDGSGVSLPTALPEASLTLALPTASVDLPSPTRTPATRSPRPSDTTEEATPSDPAEESPTSEPTGDESSAIALPPANDPTTPTPEQTPTTPTPTPTPTPTTATPTEPTAEPTSESPTPTQTQSPTETPTDSATPTETSSPTTSPSEAPAEDDAPSNAALLLGLLALVGLAVALVAFLRMRSRRTAWDARLAEERTQATWVLTGLLPAVTDPTADPQLAAASWAGAQATLDQLETGLAGLVAEGPDTERQQRANGLAHAVTGVRAAVVADLALRTGAVGPAAADPAALQASAAAVQSARDTLAAALATPAG